MDLKSGDNIRIGRALLHVSNGSSEPHQSVKGTHFFTREIVLESLEEHAVLLDEVAHKLNSIMDILSMLNEVVFQIKRILILDAVCVQLANEFSTQQDESALKSIQNRTVEVRAQSMYIPISEGEKVQGLIGMTRKQNSPPFTHPYLGLADAISHQTALTQNRLQLLEKTATRNACAIYCCG